MLDSAWSSALAALGEGGGLLVVAVVVAVFTASLGFWMGRVVGRMERRRRAVEGSRRALAGRVAEQWAPFSDAFPGAPHEARFLGDPIDYLVFRGLGEGSVEEIVFVEVKSGSAQLSGVQRDLRACVEEGRVRWLTLRVDAPARRVPAA
mgnify:CR=1 FL=1